MLATCERWRHRLPHWEVADRPHFITIRCAGSLPSEVLARVKEIHNTLAATTSSTPQFAVLQRQYFATCEKYLDQGKGFAPFQNATVGRVILDAWKELGQLSGWHVPHAVAMPNHVHFVVFASRANPEPLRMALRQFKGRIARSANLHLARSGSFWQADWFDRWLRNEAEVARVIDYIRQNPVKAGLAKL